ncbi:MAG: hypothetical protein H6982_12025 [Chromatiales bacterium]|nr:hypothetical protein [Chromatiales bacterium]
MATVNEVVSTLFLLAASAVLVLIAAGLFKGLVSGGGGTQFVSFLLESPKPGEDKGKPSISRLQMLIWNFVIAFAFLYVLARHGDSATGLKGALEAVFTDPILVLLGISNGTYVVGKLSKQAGTEPAPGQPGAAPAAATTPAGNLGAIPTRADVPPPAG